MRGVITGREVATNLGLIWREFGALCVWRCVWACVSGQRTTFLELAVKPSILRDHGHGHELRPPSWSALSRPRRAGDSAAGRRPGS